MTINDISPRFQNSAVRVYDSSDCYQYTSTAAKCLFDPNGELRVNFTKGELVDIHNGNTYKLEKSTLLWMIVDALNERAKEKYRRLEEELKKMA